MRVEGFFSNIQRANKTVEELKNNGFETARVDLNEHYIPDSRHSPRIAGTHSGLNLSGLILNGESFASDDTNSPLKAASPMVSGMGSFEEISDINYKVIVETEENYEKAKIIIQKSGGSLENYNLDLPKKIK